MKPRYEIHSFGMPDIVEPAKSSRTTNCKVIEIPAGGQQSESLRRDRAARALFSATEIVSPNNIQTDFGKDVPMTKYGEYLGRYQTNFLKQVPQARHQPGQRLPRKTPKAATSAKSSPN